MRRMTQLSHARFMFDEPGTGSRDAEHTPHTTKPHKRQWWRRISKVNSRPQQVHIGVASSGCHSTPYFAVFIIASYPPGLSIVHNVLRQTHSINQERGRAKLKINLSRCATMIMHLIAISFHSVRAAGARPSHPNSLHFSRGLLPVPVAVPSQHNTCRRAR